MKKTALADLQTVRLLSWTSQF